MNYFSKKETSCKCGCGFDITPEFLGVLNEFRKRRKAPVIITGGARCKSHNKKVGGASNSSHTRGIGIDVRYSNSQEAFLIIKILMEMGIKRIGFSTKNFIHFDIDESLPQEVFWNYGS